MAVVRASKILLEERHEPGHRLTHQIGLVVHADVRTALDDVQVLILVSCPLVEIFAHPPCARLAAGDDQHGLGQEDVHKVKRIVGGKLREAAGRRNARRSSALSTGRTIILAAV